jgi:hypothetical protein
VLGCAKDGKLIAIECKIKPRKPTQYQLEFLEEIKRRGGYAVLAYDLSDVEKVSPMSVQQRPSNNRINRSRRSGFRMVSWSVRRGPADAESLDAETGWASLAFLGFRNRI